MQNLAARVVDFSKVVVTGKNRFSLNCCGVMDILTFEAKTSVVNDASQYNDRLEDELSRELENARLVRLLCKLGFINERPEYDLDLTWAETGDVYLLKLFRDYVFHQVDEAGAPLLDLAHVLQTLNKLDVGVDEKIMLTSRDEKSCLIASYRDLKQCIDTNIP
ncbi:hypothetical protein BASA81_018452 [Batrachochytrium salamandrivorans]|nr:hypothetical protein BASA81_018452 [Batrachochytrium salamandrivorans]